MQIEAEYACLQAYLTRFIWRSNHMNKRKAVKQRFCEWGSEQLQYYAFFVQHSDTIPIIASTGTAIQISPHTTSAINAIGNTTIVHMIFVMPHAAFIAKNRSLPKTMNIRITKINVNIFISPSVYPSSFFRLIPCTYYIACQ